MSGSNFSPQAIRGCFLDFIADPFYEPEANCVRYLPDGLLITENGCVKDFGAYEQLDEQYANLPLIHYPGALIMPGFIDTHIHYPSARWWLPTVSSCWSG